jgi:hypothetical protein
MTNKDELRYLYDKAVLYEISQKFDICSLGWAQVSSSQWKASVIIEPNLFEFYMTCVNVDNIMLEVVKNKDRVVYSSSSMNDDFVLTLFKEISNPTKDLQDLLNMFNGIGCNSFVLPAQVGIIGSGTSKVNYNLSIISKAGTVCSGEIEVSISKAVSPYSLTIVYEAIDAEDLVQNPEPWTGDITDINEASDINNHDGDSSYLELLKIPYAVGVGDYGRNYLLVGFDTSGITGLSDTVRIKVDIAHKWIAWAEDVQDFYAQAIPDFSPATGLLGSIYGNVADITEIGITPLFNPSSSTLTGTGEYQIQSVTSDPVDKNLINNNIQLSIGCFTNFVTGGEYSVSITDQFGAVITASFTTDWQQARISAVTITLINE